MDKISTKLRNESFPKEKSTQKDTNDASRSIDKTTPWVYLYLQEKSFF